MEPRSMEVPSTSKGSFLSLGNLFPQSHSSVVKKLLSWKQTDEEEKWTERAISALVKKLKETKGSIKDLERALSCPGAPTKCVTIPRTLDGRLQILHRRGYPHVVYCRVWRWPDLQSHHELNALPECQYPFSKKLNKVCVNPYHYNRVIALVLPPVMVPKHKDFVSAHSLLPFQQQTEPITPQTVTYTEEGFTGLDLDAARLTSSILQQPHSNLVELQPQAYNSAYSNFIAELNINDYELTELQPPVQPIESQPPPQLMELQPPPQLMELQPPPQLMELQSPPRLISYEEQDYWASIAYYELNRRVGESFNCKNTSITVDGFTNPEKNGNRFSVGQLTNMHRNSTVERARKHIGKGIHVSYVNGQVYVECLSNASVFVQSKIFNYSNNFYSSTVCKISSGNSLKVFDNAEFAKLLSECVTCSYSSVHHLTEMCIIRIAFVKGWGAQYCRADITSTPAWIEIHIHGALTWLDKVLVEMGGPTDQISSVS